MKNCELVSLTVDSAADLCTPLEVVEDCAAEMLRAILREVLGKGAPVMKCQGRTFLNWILGKSSLEKNGLLVSLSCFFFQRNGLQSPRKNQQQNPQGRPRTQIHHSSQGRGVLFATLRDPLRHLVIFSGLCSEHHKVVIERH